jgi:hypothetical protein
MTSRLAALAGVLVLAAASIPCAAQDCPTAETVGRGFIAERGTAAKVEVQHLDATLVQTTWRSGNAVILQTLQFQGLFDLDRQEGGRRTASRPKTDLAKLFPLQAGKEIAAEFETGPAGQVQVTTVRLIVKDPATLDVGPCKFDVFAIDRSVAQGAAPPEFVSGELYAPLLKLVVAKDFKNPDGATTRTQYDKIYAR